MQINLAVAKIDKFGASKSGDTVETIERPNGGMSIVLADGQVNGISSKAISTMVCHRIIDNIGDGIRDSSAIRATSNRLYAEGDGQVIANINLISVDLQTNNILISRNNPIPVFLIESGKVECLSSESEPVGSHKDITPSIVELPIEPGLSIVVFTDGVYHAGRGNRNIPDVCTTIEALIEEQEPTAQEIAEFLISRAIRLDEGKPQDDMCVVVMSVDLATKDHIRRMNLSMTITENTIP
jgi:serine phosphatase RsbU (regulator of sigma subunit)